MDLKVFDYKLPREMIAQVPPRERTASRLMVINRATGKREHHLFGDLPGLLRGDELLVINDTRVFPARLKGRTKSGKNLEVFLLGYPQRVDKGFIAPCLIRPGRLVKADLEIFFAEKTRGRLRRAGGNGRFQVELDFEGEIGEFLGACGQVPLPPYIRRNGQGPAEEDRERYQTVYAEKTGSVAAPTAGLHFSETLLSEIKERGVEVIPLTLHVGYGTFMPLRENDLSRVTLPPESYHIPPESARRIEAGRKKNRPILAVGTTTVRALEYVMARFGKIIPGAGACDLFIHPGFGFGVVSALITNFHLPQSSLLLLVSAFAGWEVIRTSYREAVREGYRFYSYGDAMYLH
jgi:S-adenosylmethionine:tRNA ribosyltransferase-isomerase